MTPIPVRIFAQMQFGASPVIAAVATINIAIVLLAIVIFELLFGVVDALGYTYSSSAYRKPFRRC